MRRRSHELAHWHGPVDFRGVYDLVHRHPPPSIGLGRRRITGRGCSSINRWPRISRSARASARRLDYEDFCAEELELVRGASHRMSSSIDAFPAGQRFKRRSSSAPRWGTSASGEMLNGFVEWAPPPQPRGSSSCVTVEPAQPDFSGFVFKIQANMDPKHRDRIAFLRVCSGRYRSRHAVCVMSGSGKADARSRTPSPLSRR